MVSLAESGMGICQSYGFIVDERIARGALVEVLPHAAGRSRAFSLLYAPHRRLSSAARALIATLMGEDADP